MSLQIETVATATHEVVAALNRLVPQLSSSFAGLGVEDVERLVESDGTTLFVARDEGRIVGTLTLIVFEIPTGRRAWIEDVVVDESARGKGAGEALVRAAIDAATARGASTVDLTSRPEREAANALYVRVGFEQRDTNVYRKKRDAE